MDDSDRERIDALIDALADAVAKRLDERAERGYARADSPSPDAAPSRPTPLPAHMPGTPPNRSEPVPGEVPEAPFALQYQDHTRLPSVESRAQAVGSTPAPERERERELDRADEDTASATAPPPSRAASLMARLALGIVVIVVLINIPLNTRGTALARSIPNPTSLVIGNGLLVKESTSPEIWVYREGAFHWITSLDAFAYLGYRWQDVHIVEPGFVGQYPKGRPLYVLLKCDASPNIYQLDNGRKRWIVDIPSFVAQGYVWQDVKMVPCSELSNLPNGDSIPPGRGSPSSVP